MGCGVMAMAIKYAILGLLSWKPLSGYDLKKIMVDSAAFYWSGNNNQIYKTLVQLHEEGLVEIEVRQQENYPPRKEYTITDQGAAALRAVGAVGAGADAVSQHVSDPAGVGRSAGGGGAGWAAGALRARGRDAGA